MSLTFGRLRVVNKARNRLTFDEKCSDWTLGDWGNALAGETGEACNFIKKRRRGDSILASDIGKELADVVIYADIIATQLGLDLGDCVIQKFNEVSNRVGSEVFLNPEQQA